MCTLMLKLKALQHLLNKSQFIKSLELINVQTLCTSPSASEEEKERELERISKDASIDDPPTACCRSGCSNCVFIVWAEALANKMQNAGPEISKKVLDMVDDPSMKAYLEMELRLRLKK